MTGKKIIQQFGFEEEDEPKSIYPFSPVYKVKAGDQDYIIKRTQTNYKGLINYTRMLSSEGIPVVTPVSLTEDNPQLIEDDAYVVYPFIHGSSYGAKKDKIYEAGKLLGKIHALSPAENQYGLGEYDVYDFNEEEVTESVEAIAKHATKFQADIDANKLQKKFIRIMENQNALKNAELPHVATPHDYKANNLIYTPSPYLIDPDNATWIPRIFDLALALLLFHNELESAPDRLFTPSEWRTFLSGYQSHIQLTEPEILAWKQAVEHVFLDEVMWLMAEFEEDWEQESQHGLFKQLIDVLYDNSSYTLSE
ncbi:spectinomycin phosphotransferase [Oceanobacillus limi]|uniref:Spectinomycin phosphotransferase n=1 Tax=Oceanobacillus limi TaxID=930131 RepID=A0A1H9YAB6_9BACI|nr:phosphotransferase [Oceanobacillus limi]SES65793.1 spectinomycin phosphotransferase [Oceanobacillus limi]